MKNKGSANALMIIGLVVALLFGLIIFAAYHEETVEMPKAYAAWVKQTGNPKQLTYDEWRSLVRANAKQEDSTFIYVAPVNISR